jgi:hypothetical protein
MVLGSYLTSEATIKHVGNLELFKLPQIQRIVDHRHSMKIDEPC